MHEANGSVRGSPHSSMGNNLGDNVLPLTPSPVPPRTSSQASSSDPGVPYPTFGAAGTNSISRTNSAALGERARATTATTRELRESRVEAEAAAAMAANSADVLENVELRVHNPAAKKRRNRQKSSSKYVRKTMSVEEMLTKNTWQKYVLGF